MKRLVFAIMAISLVSIGLVYAAVYGADKQVCSQHGYEGNSLSPSLEGFCYFSSEKGTKVYYSVEDVIMKGKHNPKLFDWKHEGL